MDLGLDEFDGAGQMNADFEALAIKTADPDRRWLLFPRHRAEEVPVLGLDGFHSSFDRV